VRNQVQVISEGDSGAVCDFKDLVVDIAVKRDVGEGRGRPRGCQGVSFKLPFTPLVARTSSPPWCAVGYTITRDPNISVPRGVSLWGLKKESLPVDNGTFRMIDEEKR